MLSTVLEVKDKPLVLIGSKKAWLVCFSAAMFFFYEFIQMHMFNAINDTLRQTFSVNATQLGLLSSTYLLADLLFLLPAGILLDRYSTRKIILLAIFICTVGTLGFALSTNLWWAGVFHFLSGIGNAFCFLSCIMLVSRWFPANRQALVIGLVVTIAFLGGVIAQTPLASLAATLGWRQSLLLDAALGVIIMWLIYLNVEDGPNGKMVVMPKSANLSSALMLTLKNKQNWLPGIYTCLLNLPIMVLCAVWGMLYLEKVHNLSVFQASNVTSMIFWGSIVGSPIAGLISDKLARRRLPMIIGVLCTLFFMTLVMVNDHWSYGFLSMLFFWVGFFSSTQVIAYPMVAESNPKKLTGTATGLASLIIMGGAGIFQVAYGQLLDLHWNGLVVNGLRVYSAADYHFAMYLFPSVFIVALIAITFASETYGQAIKKNEDFNGSNQ